LVTDQDISLQKKEEQRTDRNAIVEEWLIVILMDKLRKAAIIAGQRNIPLVLYRKLVNESEDAVQEELATVLERYVVIQVFTYGGFIPANFQKQNVFTFDKFARVILRKNRDLLMQCLENLDSLPM
jgi:hypothetical protein